MKRAIRSHRIEAVVVLACWLGCAGPATAGTGAQFVLPSLGIQPRPTSGLRLEIETDWVQGYGHRPVRVELSASPGVPFEREVTVELGLGDWASHNYVVVTVDLDLPAGGGKVSKVVPVPQLSSAQTLNVRTLEDGRQIDELTTSHSIANGQYWGGDAGVPRVLFVGAQVPDVRRFEFLGAAPYLSYGNAINFRQFSDVFAFAHRIPDKLYDEWLFYSGLDLMFLSLDDARELAKKRPAAWRAIGDWNRCGGTLCIYGAGGDWSGLEEIERLIEAPASEKEAALPYRGWEAPSAQVFEDQVIPGIQATTMAAAAEATADGSGVQPAPTPVAAKTPDKPPFVWKPAALGKVVALGDAQPFPGEDATWRWLLVSLDSDRNAASTRWTTRCGAVPDGENPHFNDFLIGDVGLPPIRTYRVLITVFVIAIGPLNYWLLRRYGRLHLFLFTVPLAALITSVGLLAYALMSDGLVSRVRTRSLTHLDQHSGTSATAARLSYYVGLAPSDGLTFPLDTLITPLELTPSTGGYNYRQRRMIWGDQQYLTRGWLGSRTPTQYMTVRGERSQRGLDIAPSGNSISGSRSRHVITNRLGTHIRSLIVCDEAGAWHSAGDVGIDAQAKLVPLASEEEAQAAVKRFVQVFDEHAPAFPDAMSAYGARENWLWFGRSYRYNQNVSIDPTVNVLDGGLARVRVDVLARALAPRSYVAIVEQPESIVTGTDGLTETQSLHVIRGVW